jgi:hypothetical protein
MFLHSGARSAAVDSPPVAVQWRPQATLKRLRLFAGKALWWGLSTAITGPGADRSLIFQQPSLYPWLSALDNVAISTRPCTWPIG